MGNIYDDEVVHMLMQVKSMSTLPDFLVHESNPELLATAIQLLTPKASSKGRISCLQRMALHSKQMGIMMTSYSDEVASVRVFKGEVLGGLVARRVEANHNTVHCIEVGARTR